MQKKILLTAAALAIVGSTLLTAQHAFAQTTSTTPADPMSSLVEKISIKFGLNKDEVRAIFDEERQTRQAQMRVLAEERLNQLVADGKITATQKQLLIAKHQELMEQHQSKHESMQDMTVEERRAEREAHRQALEEWAEQNGIDPQYLMHFGPKGPGTRGMMPS